MADFGNITIQPGELRGIAQSIRTQKNNLETQFNNVKTQMRSLESDGWDSESGRALRARFESLENYYRGKYPPAMDSYISFLNNTADDYERAESDRMRDVENLSNMGQR